MAVLLCSALIAFFVALSQATIDSNEVYLAPVTPSERELRRDIFQNYDKDARPVKIYSHVVPVSVSVTPLSITSMSEKDQVMVLETWVAMKWSDEYLQWNPLDYDNITELRVPPTEVWKPDLALYTAIPDTSFFPKAQTNVIVYNNGMVLWVPPFTVNTRCPVPFRSYVAERTFIECNIKIGSWTNSARQMDIQLTTDKVDLTNFQDFNREWKLVKVVSNRESKKYPCCEDEYPLVNFNVTVKKRNYYLNSDN